MCNSWVHFECASLPSETADRLHNNRFVLIACTACQKKRSSAQSPTLSPQPQPQDDRLSKIEEQIANLTATLTTALSSISTDLDTDIDANTSGTEAPTFANIASRNVRNGGGRVVYAPANNEEELNHRRSIVISGVPEKGSDFQDVAGICRTLDPSAVVTEVFRMGTLNHNRSETPKPRLLKVRFPSSSVAKSILQEARRLKDIEGMQKFYIRRSMSADDRKTLAILRKKADELNEGLEENPNNRKRFVVYAEKLVVFEGCFRNESGRLIGGKRVDVQYEVITRGNDITVQVN
jgi:hypothetical protein